jgi:hypothetical protein
VHIEENEMGGICSIHDEIRNAYKILIRKPKEKKDHGRPRDRWRKISKWILKNRV